ncbi:calcium-binding and coiled-coil domain-containing protein 1-like isoform X2 [Mercenaria mercenaria]|uniref:calcium-binding and coiled-coil domain-containing protein 1-like isoform X2 n=1 Tax=Mercenaria mercenaria TaxID=6596 RepID=UPI001E1D90E3|nr:calcium-binding and coiled-coil domain-containing protein 1-like isoform X2 [Mercenaria mercenaria]
MSIALPDQEYKTMSSVETQVDISDPEGVLGVIRSLHGQLQDLQNVNQELLQGREDRIQTSADLSNQVSERISDLLNTAETMERSISEDGSAISSTDQELQDLLNEKERLEARVGGQVQALTDKDIANEERLSGFVAEELSRKIEELSNLQDRLASAQKEFRSEWEQLKVEIQQYEAEKSKYEDTANHLVELQLAKFVGAHSGSDGSSGSLIKRIVTHHLNQLTQTDLRKQLTESRMKEKDLENEIGDLVKQKQQLWKRCLDLESCLEEIQDTSDDTVMLRPAAAFTNLPDVSENKVLFPETSDLDLSADDNHGLMLHRCHKKTHLVVELSAEEREEAKATVQADVGPTDTENLSLAGPADTEQVSHIQETQEPITSAADDSGQEPEEEEERPQDDTSTQTKHDLESVVEAPKTEEKTRPTAQILTDDITHATGHAEDITFINKLRKRVGLSGRSSSSQRIKGGAPKLAASGSMRHFSPSNFLKRKR